jgi:PAS domain S-box-containing protein
MAGRAEVHFVGKGPLDARLLGALAGQGFLLAPDNGGDGAGADLQVLDGRGVAGPALAAAVVRLRGGPAERRSATLLVVASDAGDGRDGDGHDGGTSPVSRLIESLIDAGADDVVLVPASAPASASALLISRLAVLARRGPRSPGSAAPATAPRTATAALPSLDGDFLDHVLNTVADPIFVKDAQHRWVAFNDAFCSFFGYSREALLGKSDFDFFPATEAKVFWEVDERVMSSGQPHENEESVTDASGTIHTIATKKAVFRRPGGEKILVGVIRDITARKQAELALQQSQQRFRTLVESNIIGTVLMQGQGRIDEANDAFLRLVGRSRADLDAGRLDWAALTPAEHHRADKRATAELARSGATLPYEKAFICSDGRRVPAVVCLAKLEGLEGQVLGFILDDSERCRMEEQLRQSQKLEAIGRLAGGVAHDFNNILTSILGTSELLLETVPRTSPSHRKMELIHRSALRAARLISQLLAFGRKQVLSPKLLDLNLVVSELTTMLGTLIRDDIELTTTLQDRPLAVRVDPGQLEQVLVNLVINARDAMPQGGQVKVCTDRVVLGEAEASGLGAPAPGAYARLTVEDTGCGMPPEVVANVFEPFFSTKGPGQGTGLGLATVYGIVTQSGGFISVTSQVDRGSRFDIHLPEQSQSPLPPEPPDRAPEVRPRGHETVLVVEDDPDVQELIRTVLEEGGYTVLVAGDGQRAVELAATHAGRIDLLLADLVLPRLGGDQVARQVVGRRPDTRVLYFSGYAPGHSSDPPVPTWPAGSQLLLKPLSPRVLSRTVRAILDGRQRPTPRRKTSPRR